MSPSHPYLPSPRDLKRFLFASKGLHDEDLYKIALLHFGLYSVYNDSIFRPGGGEANLVRRGILYMEDAMSGRANAAQN